MPSFPGLRKLSCVLILLSTSQVVADDDFVATRVDIEGSSHPTVTYDDPVRFRCGLTATNHLDYTDTQTDCPINGSFVINAAAEASAISNTSGRAFYAKAIIED